MASEIEEMSKQKAELTKQIETHRAQLAITSPQQIQSSVGAYIQDQREKALVAAIEPYLSSTCWLLDSGASSHMTNDRSNFTTYELVQPVTIETAKKGLTLSAIGIGTVTATFMFNNTPHIRSVHNVLYVPNLTHNLLSLGKLDARGVRMETEDGRCTLLKDKVPFGEGVKCENQWVMGISIVKESVQIVVSRTDIRQPLQVYHQRFNHLNPARIQQLERDHLVSGLIIDKPVTPETCETCVVSKMPASAAQSKVVMRAKAPGDVFHMDLEFMGHASLGGATISAKLIDELSNYVWPHALKDKSGDTISTVWMTHHALMLSQFGIRIKALHTDNGTEFTNQTMRNFNATHGIEHHLTVPYRHEMNGRAERMNRTGSDAVRSMLAFAGLSRAFWAEAYDTFAYVHNRTGKSSVAGKTPYEVMFGEIPRVDHIRTFGSIAYARVTPELRKKLDPKAGKKFLIGYRHDAAFRLWDPITRTISYSRDAKFDEFNNFVKPAISASPVGSPSASIVEVDDSASESAPDSIVPELRRSARLIDSTSAPLVPDPRRSACLLELDQQMVNLVTKQRIVAGIFIPRNAAEALRSPQAVHWRLAMVYETGKLEEMKCWVVVERPDGVHIIQGMWVYNLKEEADGTLDYRARWVAHGDTQIPGLEFGETFAASGDYTAARTVVALSTHSSASLTTIDVTSAFLHSELEEDNLYVVYPTGFTVAGFSQPVCCLKRSLYGLRQAPRQWNGCLTDSLALSGYRKLLTAPSVFFRSDDRGESLIATHVDDCTASCKSNSDDRQAESLRFKEDVRKYFQFKEKDARERANMLGLTVYYNEVDNSCKLTVGVKIDRLASRYGLTDARAPRTPMVANTFTLFDQDKSEHLNNPPWPYTTLVGELLWIGTVLRVDIAFSVNVLSRFMQKPKAIHWEAAKRVVAYLKGTRDLGIVYRSGGDERPVGYSDSDWAGDLHDHKSTTGFVFMLNGGPISWRSRKQSVVAKSTAEAEYLAVLSCASEAKWYRNFFAEINRPFNTSPLIIHVDNQATQQMSLNPVYLSKTKHIDIPVHHICDEVSSGRILLQHIDGISNPADILTKPLNAPAHEKCIQLLGMC